MKTLLLLMTLATTPMVFAQESTQPDFASAAVELSQDTGKVTIASKGQDVRNVLFDLFDQSKKSFVLEPNVRFVLYLALSGVSFDEALEIVCSTASLKYVVDNGIYYVSKKPAPVEAARVEPEVSPKPLGKLTDKDLTKKVTTRFAKTDLREVFAELGRQSAVTIEVDKKIPGYKVDAYLVGTSLKYALDVLTKAVGVVYVRTDNKTIRIEPAAKG